MILKILGSTLATLDHIMLFTRFRIKPYELYDAIEEVLKIPWIWLCDHGLGEYGTNWICIGCRY